jgi:hypothetical protein
MFRYQQFREFCNGAQYGKKYYFHCAQLKSRQHKPSKISDKEKQREKEQMSSFECNGWLYITLSDSGIGPAFVTLTHVEKHVPYWDISVPDEVKEFVRERAQHARTSEVITSSKLRMYAHSNSQTRFGRKS